jgi:hypothetical protein
MKDLEEFYLSSPFFFRANLGVGSSQKGFWLELNGVLARAKLRGAFWGLLAHGT